MPRKQKLKLFRTPIGFHDAYVAAPSRKAALEAWGSNTDLFSAGIAEEATDERLLAELSERPGEVARKSRGSAKEHAAALGKVAKTKNAPRLRPGRTEKERLKKGPKPSRAALDKAEAALTELERKQSAERGALEREERALAKRRESIEEKQRQAMDKAIALRDEAEAKYRSAVAKWET